MYTYIINDDLKMFYSEHFEFDLAPPSLGIACVYENRQMFHFDLLNRQILYQQRFNRVYPYSAMYKVALVENDESKYNLIDMDGNLLLPKYYDSVSYPVEDYIRIMDKPEYIFRTLLSTESSSGYLAAENFSEELAAVSTQRGNSYFYIDKNFNRISQEFPAGSPIKSFCSGLALIKDNPYSDSLYCNKNFEIVFRYPANFYCSFFSKNGLALIQNLDSGLYGYIDKSGNIRIELKFANAQSFRENDKYAHVNINGSWMLVDQFGSFYCPPKPYRFIYTTDGKYKVLMNTSDGTHVVSNDEYTILIKDMDDISDFNNGYAICASNFCRNSDSEKL